MELLLVSLLTWLLLVFCLLPLEFLLVGEVALEARVESVECMRNVVSPSGRGVPFATCGVRRKEKDTFWISQDEHQQMKFRNKINASNSSWGILFIVMSKTKLIVYGKSNLLVPSESTVNSSSSVSHPLQEPILLPPSSLFCISPAMNPLAGGVNCIWPLSQAYCEKWLEWLGYSEDATQPPYANMFILSSSCCLCRSQSPL